MPPKENFKTLLGKRDNAIRALKELFEEFETVFEIQPQLKRLEEIFIILETKYRSIKEQQELIADKYVEGGRGRFVEGSSPENRRRCKRRIFKDIQNVCRLPEGSQLPETSRRDRNLKGNDIRSSKND
jgi:hypothetical protein